MPVSMAVAAAFSVVASVPELVAITGASLTAVTLIVRETALLTPPAPSFSTTLTVRASVEGSSDAF